jgi:GNAT superfamily N-acetyltransferase
MAAPPALVAANNSDYIALQQTPVRRVHLLRFQAMIHFRILGQADAAEIEHHLLRLNADDRYSRFHGPAGDEHVRRYVARLPWSTHSAIGAFEQGRLVGLGEIAYDKPFLPNVAELAVSVDRTMRGRGVGRELIERTVRAAAWRGADRCKLHFLQTNPSIPRIVRRLKGVVNYTEGEAVIKSERASLSLLWLDRLTEAQGSVASVLAPLWSRAA